MITLVAGWQDYTIELRFLFFIDNNDALNLSFIISTNDVIVRSQVPVQFAAPSRHWS